MNTLIHVRVVALAMAITSSASAGTVGQATQHCAMEFEVAVRQGPSTGMVLDGELSFGLDQGGALTGRFTLHDGRSLSVSGQAAGRLIGLTFELGGGQFLWGTGAGSQLIAGSDCGGAIGGTVAGPLEGDIGDWKRKGKPGPGTLN